MPAVTASSASRRAGAIAALLLGLALGASAEEPAGFGYALAHDLMSPFCPGRTLAQCPSPQADELRVWILAQEAAGATREEVEAQLVARYGEEIRPAPPAEGWSGIGAYGVPILAVVAGGPLVFLAIRRLTAGGGGSAPPQSATPPGPVADDAVEAQLERELSERGA